MHQVDKWFRFLNLTKIVEDFTSKKNMNKILKANLFAETTVT